MRSLFFKIFAIFWLAQSLIFVISTGLIIRQHIPREGAAFEALDTHLLRDARDASAAYLKGGCAAFENDPQPFGSLLFDEHGAELCRSAKAPTIDGLGSHTADHPESHMIDGHLLWLVPVTAPDGRAMVYGWVQPPPRHVPPPPLHQLLHFATPQMPVAIAIGGLTTFVLTLLFTRPLVRLRTATRSLAAGNLKVRVKEALPGAGRAVDDFEGLAHDFNHMAERLESLIGAQKLLLRDVSHELRSPLARLSVALELVREDAGPEFEGHFSRIERETGKLNLLIGQLLTLSSLDVRDQTGFGPVNLLELCESVLPDAAFEAQHRPCTVRLTQTCACTIQGDGDLLHRAIENVVRNAIRYTEPQTEVTLRLRQASARLAVLEIDDRGPGIPEADLINIFRPFYRIDRARSSSTGGFGVGLAIVERAVELHGGRVSAHNRASGGTSIRIELPLLARA